MARVRRAASLLLPLLLAAPTAALAQAEWGRLDERFGFGASATLGYSFSAGSVIDFFEDAARGDAGGGVLGEVMLTYRPENLPVRFGGGALWSPQSVDGLGDSVTRTGVFALVGALLFDHVESTMVPYVEGRIGWSRFQADAGTGPERASFAFDGLEVGAAVGVEVPLSPKAAVDVSGVFSWLDAGRGEQDGVTLPTEDERSASSIGIRGGVRVFLN